MPGMTKSAKGKVAMYVEVPPDVKAAMDELARRHNRSMSGEVITALQQYIAREQAEEAEEKEGKS